MSRSVTAFSPASIGNVAVGFDILGQSIVGAGDQATVRRIDEPTVRIDAIRGVVRDLPLDAARNTAGRALIAMRSALNLPYGFAIELDKGIALGSGMGGSAASCVAATVAANALLDEPLTTDALYPFALAGESVASGSVHGDNVGPMLIGGLVLATRDHLVRIPVPDAWHCVVVHPDVVLKTREAREALRGDYALSGFVAQSANLALVLAGCYRGEADLVRAGLADVLVEPRRAPLIKGFAAVKQAALAHDALGSSISGAGPSVFAWFEDVTRAHAAASSMRSAFAEAGFTSSSFVSPINAPAAKVIS